MHRNYILIFFLIVLLSGCILEAKTPLKGQKMDITQTKDEVLLTVRFSGNDIPKETRATLQLRDGNDEILYDREFVLKQNEFKRKDDGVVLERYLKLNTSTPFSYAEVTLRLPNETFRRTHGEKKGLFSEIRVELFPHEKQYALHLAFIDKNKKIATRGNLMVSIHDADGVLYYAEDLITESSFKDNSLLILLPYEFIPKSFYGTGNLRVIFNNREKNIEIPLRKYTPEEAKLEEENEFSSHAQESNSTIEYVGFQFIVLRGGLQALHRPEKTLFVRFDTKLKNLLNRPQYLVRNDFYMKDEKRVFYPVYATVSTSFGPLLKANEEVNATFYFSLVQPKALYTFYYGDKKLAELNGTQ